MDSILYFTFLLLLVTIVTGESPPVLICDDNEEYQQCGTWCPPTCDDFSYPLPKEPKACIHMCKPGCFCKPDYYRNNYGQCVKPENCCQGDNEQYTECGPTCVETADFLPEGCLDICVEGCFCKSNDYVRKDNSTGSPCIERQQRSNDIS